MALAHLRPLSSCPLHIVAQSAQELYAETLKAVVEGEDVGSVRQENSVGSGWGQRERPTRELRYVNLVLENPLDRLIDAPIFHLEQVIPRTLMTTLFDEIDVAVLQFYNPKALEFSDDKVIVPSNYGYRIRHLNCTDQIQLVIDQFKEDPNTRRAVIHIHAVGDHVKRYTPCIDSLHFLLRHGALECQAFWRSENALTLLPVNLFEFTMLQELIASELGVPVGPFVQSVTSLHYYLEDEHRLEANLAALEVRSKPQAMDPMPRGSLAEVEWLASQESCLRLQPDVELDLDTLSPYWQEMATVMRYFVACQRKHQVQALNLRERSKWKELLKSHRAIR